MALSTAPDEPGPLLEVLDDDISVEPVTEEAFRAEVLAFLEANAKRRDEITDETVASDRIGLFHERSWDEDQLEVSRARAWRATMFDHGFGWITGPVEHGGRALPPVFQTIYNELEAQYDVGPRDTFGIGLGMVAPTILAFAPPEVAARLLPAMFRADLVACQLFSEPGAGSDLASVSTKAIRDGDEWVLHGQKVWTSGAHWADIGEILTRTEHDPATPHRGLTVFIVDMRAPGVEIRPLRQMTGGAYFNEVFFDGARVPDCMRLGPVGGGWRVAMTTLLNERAAIGDGLATPGSDAPERLMALARRLGLADDAGVRQMVAEVWLHHQVAQYLSQRSVAGLRPGQAPGPELSLSKLALSRNLQRISDTATRMLGPLLAADAAEWGTYAWSEFVLGVPGLRIGGGTDEIMRNVVAERILGLPKEPRRPNPM